MTSKIIRDFGTEAADITAAFFLRNAVVILTLATFVLIALARP